MDDEKKYPDDYIEFQKHEVPIGKKYSWYIPIGSSSNGKYVRITIASDSGIETQEKELWDGAVMQDDILQFTFRDYTSGKLDQWMNSSFGINYANKIRATIESEFPAGAPPMRITPISPPEN